MTTKRDEIAVMIIAETITIVCGLVVGAGLSWLIANSWDEVVGIMAGVLAGMLVSSVVRGQ